MRHTAYGDAYAHDVQEIISLLVQESGCEPDEVYHLGVEENVSLSLTKGKRFRAAIVEDSSEEYVLHVEADSKEEVEAILDEVGIREKSANC